MFKVGQEVWCLLNGKGKVTSIDPHCIYEIGVTFPIGEKSPTLQMDFLM